MHTTPMQQEYTNGKAYHDAPISSFTYGAPNAYQSLDKDGRVVDIISKRKTHLVIALGLTVAFVAGYTLNNWTTDHAAIQRLREDLEIEKTWREANQQAEINRLKGINNANR